jgi:catechol 2,3-dioxygenase-like lactoylglutathione lyase family enzyme
MRTERPEPILPSRNLDETRAFYERLGFKPWFQEGEYEILCRGEPRESTPLPGRGLTTIVGRFPRHPRHGRG